MTVSVEPSQESQEHFSEIVSILSQRVKRCGTCLIAAESLRKIIKNRFGISGQKSRIIRDRIIAKLMSEDLIILWHTHPPRTRYPNPIYEINVNEWKKRFDSN